MPMTGVGIQCALLERMKAQKSSLGETQNDWRKLLMTHEERMAYIDEHYEVDEETNEILGPKTSPYEEAWMRGEDWQTLEVDLFEWQDSLTLEIPEGFFKHMEREKDLGR